MGVVRISSDGRLVAAPRARSARQSQPGYEMQFWGGRGAFLKRQRQ